MPKIIICYGKLFDTNAVSDLHFSVDIINIKAYHT